MTTVHGLAMSVTTKQIEGRVFQSHDLVCEEVYVGRLGCSTTEHDYYIGAKA